MSEKFSHLWIPDEEVEILEKKPLKIPKNRGLNFKEHGFVLMNGLKSVDDAYSHLETSSLQEEDIVIFKMIVSEEDDIFGQKMTLEKEGLKINALKNKRQAVVSTNKSLFKRLQKRVGEYRNFGRFNYFQYVDSFEPFSVEDKKSDSLKKYLEQEKENNSIDLQLMFTPNLEEEIQNRATDKFIQKVKALGKQSSFKKYKLSDGTNVIRANIPIKELDTLVNDPIIYRIEQTSFFHLSPSCLNSTEDIKNKGLDPNVVIENLPLVVVLDSGVYFPDNFKALIPIRNKAKGVSGEGNYHGTAVASKVVFSHIGMQLNNPFLTPRAKVIDFNIYGSCSDISQDMMVERIEEAVINYHDISKIYNLSSNAQNPIEGDELSIIGYHLDNLMKKYHVKFVISTGNQYLAKYCGNLDDIFNDTDARIAEPADSILGITVGSIAGVDGINMLSKQNEAVAYTRVGPGFAGHYKPDITAYGANIKKDLSIDPQDPFSKVIMPDGKIGYEAGTSFSAPVVAGDLAEIYNTHQEYDIILSQAILFNGVDPIRDSKTMSKDEAIQISSIYGRGLSDPNNCKYSSSHKVTFLRSGYLMRKNKEHVRFLMPKIQAQTKGKATTKITVTCITDSPIDKTKGEQYLGACITASLHKPINSYGNKPIANPTVCANRSKWETCSHFSNVFSKFDSGLWEIWLDLLTKWDINDDMKIPYHLVVTIEDLTQTNNIYQAIIQESSGRFKPVNTARISIKN